MPSIRGTLKKKQEVKISRTIGARFGKMIYNIEKYALCNISGRGILFGRYLMSQKTKFAEGSPG